MDKAACGITLRLPAGDSPDGIRTPVTADIGKAAGSSGQEIAKHHGKSVQVIVLGGKYSRLFLSTPVKGGV